MFARRRRRRQQRQEGQSLVVAVVTGLAAFAVFIIVLVLDEEPPTPTVTADTELVHAHGLGINPADQALFLATHTGLFRVDVATRESGAVRVGDRAHDTMAFTVAGPDHFLASGHPDARGLEEGLPPHLGLVESTDGGETWRPVSLVGEADFHVLRLHGTRLYGYDTVGRRLLASTDRGRTWSEQNAPGELTDLVANPADSRHLLAVTQEGIASSTDGARTWERFGATRGFLAWPRPRALYLVGFDGSVYASADAGRSLTPRGRIGGRPAAFFASDERELYAALHDGTVQVSRDAGVTWSDASIRSA
jgi:hypothetical protein